MVFRGGGNQQVRFAALQGRGVHLFSLIIYLFGVLSYFCSCGSWTCRPCMGCSLSSYLSSDCLILLGLCFQECLLVRDYLCEGTLGFGFVSRIPIAFEFKEIHTNCGILECCLCSTHQVFWLYTSAESILCFATRYYLFLVGNVKSCIRSTI